MLFNVTAKQSGNQVKFQIEIQGDDLKLALSEAIKEAKRIFDYTSSVIGSKEPTVSVSQSKEAIIDLE